MSGATTEYGIPKTKFGKRGFLELQNCPKQETNPLMCSICDKKMISESAEVKCIMMSSIKCGNSMCFNYDKQSDNNCNRFGKVIECRLYQQVNQI